MSKKVAFLVAPEGIEQVELTEPWKAVTDAGHDAVLVSTESGTVQMYNHLDKADTQDVDVTVGEAKVDDFDALVLPGGVANPDALRTDGSAVGPTFIAVSKVAPSPWVTTPRGSNRVIPNIQSGTWR